MEPSAYFLRVTRYAEEKHQWVKRKFRNTVGHYHSWYCVWCKFPFPAWFSVVISCSLTCVTISFLHCKCNKLLYVFLARLLSYFFITSFSKRYSTSEANAFEQSIEFEFIIVSGIITQMIQVKREKIVKPCKDSQCWRICWNSWASSSTRICLELQCLAPDCLLLVFFPFFGNFFFPVSSSNVCSSVCKCIRWIRLVKKNQNTSRFIWHLLHLHIFLPSCEYSLKWVTLKVCRWGWTFY